MVVRKYEGKRLLGRPSTDGRTILKWTEKISCEVWAGSIWLKIENTGRLL
jgi:hypothetical protein